MAPDKIREALRILPFRPFVIEIAGGKRVPVKHPDYAHLSPNGRTLIVYTNDDDAMEMIDVLLVSNVSYGTPRATATRRK